MKASLRFIFVALAATAALAGCTKEITPPSFENDKVNPAAEGSRVIAVSFAQQTKTELDGFQPRFVDKDSILISNREALDTCEVKVDDKSATITTKLTGPLTAVYPYTAAKMNETNKNQIDTVLVSTEQDGSFASANICMAKNISEDAKTATFENKTAVFKITPSAGAGTKYVEVSAEGFNIANCYQTGSAYTSFETIHVATTTADSVYVSILVPENLTVGKLTFSDGTNEKTVTGDKASTKIEAGSLYTVTEGDWESPEDDTPEGAIKGVFTVGAGPDGEAGTADDVKVYFSQGNLYAKKDNNGMWNWGFYDKQYQYNSLSTSSSRTAAGTDTEIDLFTWGYSESTSLLPAGDTYVTAHTTTEDKQLVYNTDSGDDWGVAYCSSNNIAVGTWRTLSKDEWQYLFNTRTFDGGTGDGHSYKRATINSDATSVFGIILYPDNYTGTAKTSYTSTEWTSLEEAGCVFLPAAGFRFGSNVSLVGDYGFYWSSTAGVENFAYFVSFNRYSVTTPDDNLSDRYQGYSVRLVTDVSAAPDPEQESSCLILGPDMIIMKMKEGVPKPGIDDVTYPWIEYVNPISTLDDGTAEVQTSNRWTNLNPEIGEIGDGTNWLQVTGKNGSVNSPVLSPQWGKYLIFSVQNVYGMQVFATGSASGSADDGNCLKLTATSDDDEVIEASSTPGGIYGKGTASDFCTINLNPEKSYHVKVEAAVKDIQVTGIKLIREPFQNSF